MERFRPLAVIAVVLCIAGCNHSDRDASASATASAVLVDATPVPAEAVPAASALAAAASALASPVDSGSPVAVASTLASGLPSPGLASPGLASPGLVATAPPAVAFGDIAGDQHAAAIVALGGLGVLDATSGNFMPGAPIARRDFVRWLFKTNNAVFANSPSHVLHAAAANDPSDFSDVSPKDPDFPYIQGMSTAGVSVGFPDKTFKPDQSLTREQAIAIKSALDFGGVNASYAKDVPYARYNLPQWKDRNDVSATFLAAVAQDIDQERDSGVNNIGRTFGTIVTFRPTKPLSRAEAAEMLQIVGGHASNMSSDNAMRSVANALHPTPMPT